MRMKIMMFIGTVAIAITITGSKWVEGGADSDATGIIGGGHSAGAAVAAVLGAGSVTDADLLPELAGSNGNASAAADPYRELLGVQSDRELYDAVYEGRTLADLAEANGRSAEEVVRLQVAELAVQLADRLAAGSISRETYEAQLAELPEIVERSVYGAV